MKKFIDPFDYSKEILKAVQSSALLTTMANGQVNTMTIGWGTMGVEWDTQIFIAFVREHRFTKQLIDANPEFTVNIPYGEFDKRILGVCGSKSAREMDKIKELGLTLEKPEKISVPGIKELPLTLECKVIYRQAQERELVSESNRKRFHPENIDGLFHLCNRDYHTAYYGEIVSAYIIE